MDESAPGNGDYAAVEFSDGLQAEVVVFAPAPALRIEVGEIASVRTDPAEIERWEDADDDAEFVVAGDASVAEAAALARTRTLEFLERYLARGEKS